MNYNADIKNKVLLFGGTFNPIHNGHLQIAQEAVERLNFNKVIFIPSSIPPHKESSLLFSYRLKMIELAIDGVKYFEISDIEAKREGLSYTIDTFRYFKRELGENTKIYWMIGTDTIEELKDWYKIKELIKECQFVIAERNRYKHIDVKYSPIDYFTPLWNPVLDISSTEIREKVKTKKRNTIKYLVPESVEKYIYDNKLYKDK